MMKISKFKWVMVPFLSVLLSVLALLPLSIAPVAAAVTPPTVSTADASSITINSAILNGNLSSLGTAASVNVFFEYGTTTSYGNSTSARVMTTTGLFSANLNGISPGVTYHFRAKADGGVNGATTGEDKTFTAATTPPAARTSMATNVIANGAVLNGSLDSLGTATSVGVYFDYGMTTSYGSTTSGQTKTTTGTFSISLTNLTPGTIYHFRARADGGIHGTASGLDMNFTTPVAIPPQVSTTSAISVTNNTVTLVGNISTPGSAASVTVSFDYGTTTNYGSTTSTQTKTGAGYTGGFSIDITNTTPLTPGTTYHFRAKADGGANGIGYGEDMTFTTLGIAPLTLTAPTVNTSEATNITSEAATLGGNLLLLGTASSVSVFFEYGKTTSYGSSTIAQAMPATGNFSTDIAGLTPGATYHFRAKADGGANGIGYGEDMTFTTATVSPTVDTSAATGITNNAVTMNGNLTSTGTAASIKVYFEYGITDNYGITTSTQTLTGTGTYSINLTGLKSNTLYHYRAKADGGANGSATGNDMTFTTRVAAPSTTSTVNTSSTTIITTGSTVVTNNPTTTQTQITTTPVPVKTTNSKQILIIGVGAAVVVGLLVYLLIRRRT